MSNRIVAGYKVRTRNFSKIMHKMLHKKYRTENIAPKCTENVTVILHRKCCAEHVARKTKVIAQKYWSRYFIEMLLT